MEEILVNSHAYKEISADAKEGRFSHAYLFISPDAEQLKAFALLAAKLVLCNNTGRYFVPCGRCKNCTKIDAGIHTDVISFGLKSPIVVNDTQTFLDSVPVRPYECDKKVYILNGIQDMNEVSQNKILKTLEEPPTNTHILLTTTNEYKVLQTIKSRTKRIYLDPFSIKELTGILNEKQVKNADLLALLASGNLSVAMALSASNGAENIYSIVEDSFKNLKKTKDLAKYAAKIESNKKYLPEIIDFFALYARDILYVKNNAVQLILNEHKKYDIIELANNFSDEALTAIINEAIESKRRLFYNVSSQNVIDTFLLKFLEVRIRCR